MSCQQKNIVCVLCKRYTALMCVGSTENKVLSALYHSFAS